MAHGLQSYTRMTLENTLIVNKPLARALSLYPEFKTRQNTIMSQVTSIALFASNQPDFKGILWQVVESLDKVSLLAEKLYIDYRATKGASSKVIGSLHYQVEDLNAFKRLLALEQ